MSTPINVESISDPDIVTVVQFLTFRGENVPSVRTVGLWHIH